MDSTLFAFDFFGVIIIITFLIIPPTVVWALRSKEKSLEDRIIDVVMIIILPLIGSIIFLASKAKGALHKGINTGEKLNKC